MPNDTAPKRLNSTLLDTGVQNALRKYISTTRQQGRESRALFALDFLTRFDVKAYQKIVAEHKKADYELRNALIDYRMAVEQQGRPDRIQWVNDGFAGLDSDALIELRDELAAKVAELAEKISALTPAKKK